jgi:phosphotransferase system enzyme I (PtsI)
VVERVAITEDAVAGELERLHRAIEAVVAHLDALEATSHDAARDDTLRAMLAAQRAMCRDPLLIEGCERAIRERRTSAAWAVRDTTDALAARLAAVSDAYLRERADDVVHVAGLLLHALAESDAPPAAVRPGAIVVAHDLGAAAMAELLRTGVAGLVLERGSPTTHAAILARGHGIPMLTGAGGARERVTHGHEVVVDALRGELVLAPDDGDRARVAAHAQAVAPVIVVARSDVQAVTRDGVAISVGANIEHAYDAARAVREGAHGVALFRTEYLYLGAAAPPDEDTQARLYADAARAVAPHPLVVRTFDLGADKQAASGATSGVSGSALGLRGLRLALRREDDFLAQLRGILRASLAGEVRLLFPMVVGAADLRAAQRLVARAAGDLTRAGIPHRSVHVGAMIEVPSAALMADELARDCDFFSVGTNDLAQYTLAADRGDPHLAHLARPHDPAVLRLLDVTARAASAHRLPLSMCGDMAADAHGFPLAIGLGYTSIGVPVPALGRTRARVMTLEACALRELAAQALQLATPEEVEALVTSRIGAAP